MSERKSQALGRHVIIADDDRAIRLVISDALEGAGYSVSTVVNGEDLWAKVRDGAGDVVITDVLMPGRNGLDLLPLIKEHRPELPVIVMSAQNTLMTAVKATEKGAFDYLAKPFDLDDLERMVAKALERRVLVDEETAADNPVDTDTGLIGRSPAMQGLFRSMARLMNTDLTVMIAGESGTGKELVAKALHDMGKRRGSPFVALNMAAIPRDLIESELFGHEKGAFTGAHMRAIGRFEQAQGGTLFLDEIGDMPMEAQTRLLRVLQEGIFFRIGGEKSIDADARIIAASNRDLGRLVAAGTFREDLYYRLNVVPLYVPPLRDRAGDIPDLVAHFVAAAVKEGLPAKRFDKKALLRLQRYHWPGNVRELENLVHRLLALAAEELVDEATLNRFLDERTFTEDRGRDEDESSDGLQAVVERQLRRYFDAHGDVLPPAGLYARVLREVERPLLTLALKATGGNQLQAAELLGVNRNTLRKKMRDLEILSRNFKA